MACLGTLARLAPFAAFLTGLAFLADLPLDGATWGFRGATLAFVVAFGSWQCRWRLGRFLFFSDRSSFRVLLLR